MKHQTLFIGITSISLLIFSIAYAFGQYVRMKEHNREVISSIRLCADDNLSTQSRERCSDLLKKQYLFTYPPKEENSNSRI